MSPLMRRRPVLRAAAVGGGAYVAGKRRGQAQEQPQERAPETAAAPAPDPYDRLRQLGELHDQGVLTDQEFATEKARLLGSS
jgi:putative oligomerization/nucleic acid binding protein